MSIMRKALLLIAALEAIFCLHIGDVSASESITIDGTLSLGLDDFGYGDKITPGYGVGVNIDMTKYFFRQAKERKLLFRADINYYQWRDRIGYLEWSYTRTPVFLGGRFFSPYWPVFYLEGGLEYIFVSTKSNYTGPLFGINSEGFKTSHRDFDVGITPGLGIEIPIGDKLVAGMNARAHFTYDFYATIGISVGYRF